MSKKELAAYEEIAAYKWSDGFSCENCGSIQYIKGSSLLSRRCSKCKTDHSVKANTAFERLRMPCHIGLKLVKDMIASGRPLNTVKVTNELASAGIKLRQQTVWALLDRIYEYIPMEKVEYESAALFVSFIKHNKRFVASCGKVGRITRYSIRPIGIVGDKEFAKVIGAQTKENAVVAAFNLHDLNAQLWRKKKYNSGGFVQHCRPTLPIDAIENNDWRKKAIELAMDVQPWITGDRYNLWIFKCQDNSYDSLMNLLTRPKLNKDHFI